MKFKAISNIQLQKIREAVEAQYKLEKPTYAIQLPGGKTQIATHDEKSIVDKDTTQEEKDLWTAYQNAYQKMQVEINEKCMNYAFYEGVEIEEVPQEWLDKQQWLGLGIPDNKYDLKVRYITTELLKTPYDIKNAWLEILKLSMKGMDNSAIKAAESTFLSTLQE